MLVPLSLLRAFIHSKKNVLLAAKFTDCLLTKIDSRKTFCSILSVQSHVEE